MTGTIQIAGIEFPSKVQRMPSRLEKIMDEFSLTSKDIEDLRRKGYTIVEEVSDEGHTRGSFKVKYQSGKLVRSRIGKIPRSEIDDSSVTTLINTTKGGDINERELVVTNKLSHPNVIEIYDAFPISGARTVTIEEDFDAISLTDLVRMSGPIMDPDKFKNIFSQAISGLEYFHDGERIIHGDIKPSNLLIGRKTGQVKWCDLQNARKIDDPSDGPFCSKGGTKNSHPYLINGLLSGQRIPTSIRTDLYSLGTTMYEALTGEPLQDLALIKDPEGKPIELNGRTINIALKLNGERIDKIDEAEHERILKKRLKKVPFHYRRFLHNLMSLQSDRYDVNCWFLYSRLKEDFERSTKKGLKNIVPWRKIGQYAGTVAAVAGFTTGIIGGCNWMKLQEEKWALSEPSISEILSSENFCDGDLEYVVNKTDHASLQSLGSVYEEVVEKLETFDEDHEDATSSARAACDLGGMSRRMAYSIIRASLMEDQESKEEEYGPNRARFLGTLVPVQFYVNAYNLQGMEGGTVVVETRRDELKQIHPAMRYLKRCIGTHSSIADIYATYFCDEMDEIFDARRRAGNTSYFAVQDDEGVRPGYRDYLPEVKRRLIDRALALYYITDEKGDVHTEVLDENHIPTEGTEINKYFKTSYTELENYESQQQSD